MARVITISREFGSGGREIGVRLAKKLGIPFYDKEIISLAAENTNIAEEVFHANDEIMEEQKREIALISPLDVMYEVPVSDQIFVAQSQIIRQLAQQGPCVIIGRCSDIVVDESFNVFISAGFKARVERMLQIEPEISRKDMEKKIKQIDTKRQDYYQYYTGNVWGKPQNYHISLNSAKLGVEKCVELLAACL